MKQLLTSAALILILTATTILGADAQTTKQHSPARQEYIEVEKNVRLHVTDLGDGKPVVLIHGFPLSDAMYEYQYAYLVQQGFRVIGITLRGFGLSDKPYSKYDYDVFADDIKTVLDKLNIQNATLGGFSMGGAVVIHYVARHNSAHVSKLALFGAAAPVYTKRADWPYVSTTKEAIDGLIRLNNTNRPQLFAEFGKGFTANDTSVSPGLSAWLSGINWQASSYAMAQSLASIRDADLRSDLKKINIPTLILHGKLDKLCPFDLAGQLNANIKNSVLVPFEKSGHALFIEELDKFNTTLGNFAQQ